MKFVKKTMRHAWSLFVYPKNFLTEIFLTDIAAITYNNYIIIFNNRPMFFNFTSFAVS